VFLDDFFEILAFTMPVFLRRVVLPSDILRVIIYLSLENLERREGFSLKPWNDSYEMINTLTAKLYNATYILTH